MAEKNNYRTLKNDDIPDCCISCISISCVPYESGHICNLDDEGMGGSHRNIFDFGICDLFKRHEDYKKT